MAMEGHKMTSPEEEYRTIPLTRGQFAIVDSDDYEMLSSHKWRADWDETLQSFYALRSKTRGIAGQPRQVTVRMHRVVMGLQHGDRRHVDHVNHNTLDNRKANLRVVSCAQNQHNNRIRRDNSTGRRGVSWHRRFGKYHARIVINGKAIHLGWFDDLENASMAYEKAHTKRLRTDGGKTWGVDYEGRGRG